MDHHILQSHTSLASEIREISKSRRGSDDGSSKGLKNHTINVDPSQGQPTMVRGSFQTEICLAKPLS